MLVAIGLQRGRREEGGKKGKAIKVVGEGGEREERGRREGGKREERGRKERKGYKSRWRRARSGWNRHEKRGGARREGGTREERGRKEGERLWKPQEKGREKAEQRAV